jgi:hypothetical protein
MPVHTELLLPIHAELLLTIHADLLLTVHAEPVEASFSLNHEPRAMSYLHIIFWIPAFAGMTILTDFNDCDTVSSGGQEG